MRKLDRRALVGIEGVLWKKQAAWLLLVWLWWAKSKPSQKHFPTKPSKRHLLGKHQKKNGTRCPSKLREWRKGTKKGPLIGNWGSNQKLTYASLVGLLGLDDERSARKGLRNEHELFEGPLDKQLGHLQQQHTTQFGGSMCGIIITRHRQGTQNRYPINLEHDGGPKLTPKHNIVLRVDSPFFSTIVLSKTGSVSLGFRRFSRKKDPWKEWKWKVPLEHCLTQDFRQQPAKDLTPRGRTHGTSEGMPTPPKQVVSKALNHVRGSHCKTNSPVATSRSRFSSK